jgi:hypothetical protein
MLSTLLPKVEDLRNGREANFAGAELDSNDLRSFLLQLDPDAGKTPRCFIRNAVFPHIVDLSDGREPGGSALPALEFHGCTFHAGFCADGARIERLEFYCCTFVAEENISNIPWPERESCASYKARKDQDPGKSKKLRRPVNCISLRHCRVETELRLEFLSPVDHDGRPGVLTVDAFAIRVGTNVHISDTTLRAQEGESSDISVEAHYALHLATASVGGDVQLMPNVALEGGLKMRDAQVGGSIWGMDLTVTDGERRPPNRLSFAPRNALWLDTTDIQGNLMLTNFTGRGFNAKGTVMMLNATVAGAFQLSGYVRDRVVINGATVNGGLTLYGVLPALYGKEITIDGECTIACSAMQVCSLIGAHIRGPLDVRNSTFQAPVLAVAKSGDLICYPGMKVVEVLWSSNAWGWRAPGKYIATYLVSEKDQTAPLLLTGESIRLHSLNRQTPSPLKLGTPSEAREYLKLFCAAVWGEHGSFAIIDDVRGLPESFDREKVDPRRLACEIEPGDELWRANAYVKYGREFFEASFKIDEAGMVTMTDDNPVGSYEGPIDEDRLTWFQKPYRIPPEKLTEYWSDFMGPQPSFEWVSPKSAEGVRWQNALRQEDDDPDADLSGASCQQLRDLGETPESEAAPLEHDQPLTNVFSSSMHDRPSKRLLRLVWPPWTRLEEFDYRQLSSDDDRPEAKRQRLEWIRGADEVPESRFRSALTLFVVTTALLGSLVAGALALAWLWTKFAHPTDEYSAHFGWRFLAVLAIVLSPGIFAGRMVWGSKKGKEIWDHSLRLLPKRVQLWPKQSNLRAFSAQPYAHLAMVLRERGDDSTARTVEAEKMWLEAVQRSRTSYGHWLAKQLWWRPYGVMFQFGLSPLRAFFTVLFFWCLGWGATYLLSNNGMLRANVARVAPAVVLEDGKPGAPAMENVDASAARQKRPGLPAKAAPEGLTAPMAKGVIADFSCNEGIEPALYAFELMAPIVNLHQVDRCELRSKPHEEKTPTPPATIVPGIKNVVPEIRLPVLFSYGWFWEYARAVYMLLGSVITSLALLTVSGIARRWEH